MKPVVILDLSRLLSRVLHDTPTGVDRVEMAYARELLRRGPDGVRFAAVHPAGVYGRLPTDAVVRFLDRTELRWEHGGLKRPWSGRSAALQSLSLLRPRPVRPDHGSRPRVYLQSSPHHLTKPGLVDAILRRENARFVCLVHDLIPLQFPEYARPDGAAQHRLRIETIVRFSHGIIANSHDTLAALRPWIDRAGVDPKLAVAHLGIQDRLPTTPAPSPLPRSDPYFVCLGTIEPRKNHLLLLNLWRRIAAEHADGSAPRLLIIGRRGWENEQIVDMLDRCPGIQDVVEEYGGLSDQHVAALLSGSRALLLPSFAEGYGMPVTEALSAGVPVICSDLPALREAGGNVPDFLDPLDGPAWLRAIRDYAKPDSDMRARQLDRMKMWQPTNWSEHIQIVQDLVEEIAA